ncbi:MAG TPA: 4Fe-4S dicluster domain-containing protein [Nitrososphaerales archaeon]|nr:4Fe-4S dicluster domain-containing protein [Nitrososphaerales archaeon]
MSQQQQQSTPSTSPPSTGAPTSTTAPASVQPAAREQSISVEEKLYLAKYKLDERPHLVIFEQDVCRKCAGINGSPQPCMILCPADVYKWEERNGLMENVVSYDNCVECGACRIICPYTNIEWKFPRWGRGLSHRYG